jgi:hypothetical protein
VRRGKQQRTGRWQLWERRATGRTVRRQGRTPVVDALERVGRSCGRSAGTTPAGAPTKATISKGTENTMATIATSLALPVRVAPAARAQRTRVVVAAAPKAAVPLASARPVAPLGLGARLRVAPAFHQVRQASPRAVCTATSNFRTAAGPPTRHSDDVDVALGSWGTADDVCGAEASADANRRHAHSDRRWLAGVSLRRRLAPPDPYHPTR